MLCVKSQFQRLLQSVSSSHGRILIYVWAVEQDELSKRKIPVGNEHTPTLGTDVVVPWVLSKELKTTGNKMSSQMNEPRVLNRYYHMFAKGELRRLVEEAITDLGLQIGSPPPNRAFRLARGVEFVQDGWERSNYYVELRCWENRH
jgi:tRNA (uracil-5-)-methyltransferase TRM9